MLGRTNAVYKEISETAELSLGIEEIITPTSASIVKIEHLNDKFFAFTDDWTILYGEDMEHLQFLKKDGENLVASSAVYKDGTYGFLTKDSPTTLYTSSDLSDYEEKEIKTEEYNTKNGYIGMSSDSKIVILTGYVKGSNNTCYCIGIFESFDEISWDKFIIKDYDYSEHFTPCLAIWKDRFILDSESVISLDGSINQLCFSKVTCADITKNMIMFYKKSKYADTVQIYISTNGINARMIGEYYIETDGYLEDIMLVDYEMGMLGVYLKCGISDSVLRSYKWKFCLVNSVDQIGQAIEKLIEINVLAGTEGAQCFCQHGIYTYLGATGGSIYKTWIDESGSSTSPEVGLVKTLSAKQALQEAKKYCDNQYADLAERIAVLEALREG